MGTTEEPKQHLNASENAVNQSAITANHVDKTKTGVVFIAFSESLFGSRLDESPLIQFAETHPLVSKVWSSNDLPLNNPSKIAELILSHGIERLIVAGEVPGFYKSFFSKAMQLAGKNPEGVTLAGFREFGIASDEDMDLAKTVMSCAINNVPFETVSIPEEVKVNPETLIIGGGIAGVQASLEIADAGQKVHLVERTGTIGGYMATFDKTFPTLDCAACILTPKMGEVGQHPNINLLTYSEVKEISGSPGDYTVRVLQKARYINSDTCIGCGSCAEKCPGKTKSEFDSGTTIRRAAYIPFPQAVPNKYLIDGEHCTFLLKGKCGTCLKKCPVPDCINFDEKDKEVTFKVGNIIIATGYKPFDAARDERYGYGKYPNVVTSLEFERLVNASGPTGGQIFLRSQDKKGNWLFKAKGESPKSVAIIHCVGSRDRNFNHYCSKVCCMYSLKLAHLVVEKLPGAEVFQYYIDMRAFGKGYEDFYNRIKNEGVNVIRGRTSNVTQVDDKLLLRSEDIAGGRLIEQEVDMVVLSVGMEPREDAAKVAEMVGITQSTEGWFVESDYVNNPTGTFKGGISIAGACQGPKDIPDTVAQASAAASRVLQSIMIGRVKGNVSDLTLADMEGRIKKLA